METVAKRLYEGMFLVDSAQAAADWEATLSIINNILQRADAEVVSMRKWQERKLAYDIDHKTRGTYILCYFNASGERIAGIEKDVLLSEDVMRVLILTTEKRPPEMIAADIKEGSEEKPSGAPTPAAAVAPVAAEAAVPAPEAPVSEPAVEPAAEATPEPALEPVTEPASEAAEAAEPETASDETSAPVDAEAGEVKPEAEDEGTEKAVE